MWNILVVDDNFINRQLITHMLADYAVCDGAANGAEAVEAFNNSLETRNHYNLILLDIAMPGINGLEFLEILRDHEKNAGIELGHGVPIIIVTAFKEQFLKAFELGCDDYILKPVNKDELLGKIIKRIGPPDTNTEES